MPKVPSSHIQAKGSNWKTLSLGINRPIVIFSDDEQGVLNHLLSIIFRFHYHSQKVSQDP